MGAVVTAIIQSSAATAGILVVLASQGLLDLQMGIAIALGANVGTCVTAALAAIGRPRAGARVAAVHVMFNVVGVLVWVWFIPQLEAIAVWLSPTADHLVGSARIAAETPRQLANAHTLFNVVNVLLFIGFTRPLARFAERLLPDRPEDLKGQARYLDDDVLDTPDVALELARREIARLGERVRDIVAAVGPTILHGSVAQLQQLEVMDDQIDLLYADIMGYLRRIGLRELAQEQSAELLGLVAIASDLEAIGDIVEVNLTHLGHQRIAQRLRASGPTERVVTDFHRAVLDRITAVVDALREEDPDRAADLARDVAMRADELSTGGRQPSSTWAAVFTRTRPTGWPPTSWRPAPSTTCTASARWPGTWPPTWSAPRKPADSGRSGPTRMSCQNPGCLMAGTRNPWTHGFRNMCQSS
jgi:phosphate:Na+ symporter